MKLFIPIKILFASSLLVACDGGVEVIGIEANGAAPDSVNTTFMQTDLNTRNNPQEWFDEAEVLAQPGQDEIVYLEQLGALLTHYVEITKESGYPAGLNYEITNQLLGQNSNQIAVIDTDHPRVNADGEIIDSWGTPYYFHSETSLDISIQSAGPDLIQYTADDIVYEELNQLAGLTVLDISDDIDDSGLELGAAVEATPSTFTSYQTGELLPR